MATAMEVRDTEVVAKAKRRRFSAEYKRRILQEAEKARSAGEIGVFRSRISPTPGARVGVGIRRLRGSESPRFQGRRAAGC
jgi:hypothetical protein